MNWTEALQKAREGWRLRTVDTKRGLHHTLEVRFTDATKTTPCDSWLISFPPGGSFPCAAQSEPEKYVWEVVDRSPDAGDGVGACTCAFGCVPSYLVQPHVFPPVHRTTPVHSTHWHQHADRPCPAHPSAPVERPLPLRIYVCSRLSPGPDTNGRNRMLSDNQLRARELMRDVLAQGHAPFVPHLLYPQVLDEFSSRDRKTGLAAGELFLQACDEVWVDGVGGLSSGMKGEVELAQSRGIPVVTPDRAPWTAAAPVAIPAAPTVEALLERIRTSAIARWREAEQKNLLHDTRLFLHPADFELLGPVLMRRAGSAKPVLFLRTYAWDLPYQLRFYVERVEMSDGPGTFSWVTDGPDKGPPEHKPVTHRRKHVSDPCTACKAAHPLPSCGCGCHFEEVPAGEAPGSP